MKSITILDPNYKDWVKELSLRYRKSQIKAAVKVNREMLSFYWSVGKDITEKEYDNKYGSAFYKNLSVDLIAELPNVEGLSERNLRYMKSFYTLYSSCMKTLPQSVAKSENEILPQLVAELSSVPWGHHRLIIDKCKGNVEMALFYVRMVNQEGWSRDMLLNFISTDLYERQGKSLSNFNNTLPSVMSDLAQEITRDPYNFAFTGITGKYNESLLKKALVKNVTQFLLELGTGFAYVGKEHRLQIDTKEKFIDLLFYNLNLSCYCAIEVKIGEFDFQDMGQIQGYVVAVNHLLRKEGRDNPTIGILICKSKNNTLAQYALEGTTQPIAISEYDLQRLYPEKVEGTIPTIAEIENAINYLDEKSFDEGSRQKDKEDAE